MRDEEQRRVAPQLRAELLVEAIVRKRGVPIAPGAIVGG